MARECFRQQPPAIDFSYIKKTQLYDLQLHRLRLPKSQLKKTGIKQ